MHLNYSQFILETHLANVKLQNDFYNSRCGRMSTSRAAVVVVLRRPQRRVEIYVKTLFALTNIARTNIAFIGNDNTIRYQSKRLAESNNKNKNKNIVYF